MLMKMITIAALSTLLFSSCGSVSADDPKSLVAIAKDNMAKAKKYHELANEAKLKQASLQGFIAGWIEECKVKGNNFQLEMQADGDPACVQKTAPPTPNPASIPPPNGPATTSGDNSPANTGNGNTINMSRPSNTKTPITPAKK